MNTQASNPSLPFFCLETSKLWNHKNGPRFGGAQAELLEQADKSLRNKFLSGKVGFFDWPNAISEAEISRMETVTHRLRHEFNSAVIFGIGGSFLGPAAIVEALRSVESQEDFPLYWVSNVDPAAIRRMETLLTGKKTSAIITSKSGGTVETLSAFFHFTDRLDPKGYVCITDPEKGELRRLAKTERWESFDVPPNVGGRFSVLTAVGLIPALLAGLDARRLLEGAREMRDKLETFSATENPAYRLALAQFLWDTEYGRTLQYLMPYQQNLKLIADWYVQLWGESLGKKRLSDHKSVGFTPVSALGTTDQHSLLQLFKEGPANKIVGFVDVFEKNNPLKIRKPKFTVQGQDYLFGHSFNDVTHHASLATEASLNNSGTPTYRVEISQLDERVLGAFLFFSETACALAGELYGVDAFDQPGVEEAKRLLRDAL